jgi:cytoskeleton protein RodZ
MSSAGSAGGAAPASGAAASGAASAQTAAADPNAVLSFSARSEAWISVTDAAGKQVLRRLVKAGETVAVPGEPPLAVVVGNAAGVDVSVRGKAFDLKELTRSGGVARFEVKP